MKLKDTQLSSQIKKLHYQLSFSHDLNKKLSEQLRQYQAKYGLQTRRYKPQSEDLQLVNLNNYIQQMFYIQPLLLCYEDKMTKLEMLVNDLKQDSKLFELKIKQIVAQNQFLRNELQDKCRMILQQKQSGGMDMRYLRLQNENLREKQQIILQQNEILKVGIQKLKDEINELKKQRRKQSDLQQGFNRKIELMREQNRQLNVRCLQKDREFELIKNRLKNDRILYDEMQKKNTQIQSELSRIKNELKLKTSQYENLKQLYEQNNENVKQQLDNLRLQLKNSQRHQSQLFNKNISLQTDLQNKNNIAHNIQLRLSSTQTNNSNLLQMLQSYQNKVSHLSKKIKKLQDQIKQFNQKFSLLQKQKQLLGWKLQQKQKFIQRRQTQVKLEKQRLSKNYHQRLQSIRKNMDHQNTQQQDTISNLKSTLIALQMKYQKIQKDYQLLKTQNIKLLN